MKNRLQRVFFSLVAIWCLLCLCLRCGMNLSGFQTGRTVGEGAIETGISYNRNLSPTFFNFDEEVSSIEEDIDRHGHVEANAFFGISERFDVGIQMGFPTNYFGVDAKYLLSKNNESLFALSLGAGGGLNSGGAYFQIPVYFSIHPSQSLSIYYTPRQIFQGGSYFYEDKTISLRGMNAGIMWGGDDFQIAIDGGYFFGNAGKYNLNLNTVGLGFKLKFY